MRLRLEYSASNEKGKTRDHRAENLKKATVDILANVHGKQNSNDESKHIQAHMKDRDPKRHFETLSGQGRLQRSLLRFNTLIQLRQSQYSWLGTRRVALRADRNSARYAERRPMRPLKSLGFLQRPRSRTHFSMMDTSSVGLLIIGTWPFPSMTTKSLPGISDASAFPSGSGWI